MIEVVYIALGSNLGDRPAHLTAARDGIDALPATRIVAASAVDETEPLGGLTQPAYLNQMLQVETTLEPLDLLRAVQAIELAVGRTRDGATRWAARTLDIDLVLFGARTMRTDALVVPHPGLGTRDFWQRELAELGVDWRAAIDVPAEAHT